MLQLELLRMRQVCQTTLQCGIVVFSFLSLIWYFIAPSLVAPSVIGFLGFLLAFATFWGTKNHSSYMWPVGLFILAIGTSVTMFWFYQDYYAQLKMPVQPFLGMKVLSFFIAFLAPPILGVAWVSFTLIALATILQYFMWPYETQMIIDPFEPWVTLIIIVCAIFLYSGQLKVLKLIHKENELVAMRRFANLMLGAQHFLNSPLQTIELSSTLLTQKNSDTQVLKKAIETSFEKIRRINRIFSIGESQIQWDQVKMPTDLKDFEQSIFEWEKELKLQS